MDIGEIINSIPYLTKGQLANFIVKLHLLLSRLKKQSGNTAKAFVRDSAKL